MNHAKIAVIGSTGRTGRLVLDEGILRGHAMTAFTRRPGELAGVLGLAAVISGDGRNIEDVRRAVRGQDAVISIVSSEGFGATTVMSDVVTAELAAMREAGVRRIVVVSVSARRPVYGNSVTAPTGSPARTSPRPSSTSQRARRARGKCSS